MVAYIRTVQTADSIYGSICVCVCIGLWLQADKGQELYHPWFTCIWPKLERGVKCDLSRQCFALCSEDKDIYWAAHNTALITDQQLYPPPCGCVVNVASLARDIFSVIPSLWFLSWVFQSASASFSRRHFLLRSSCFRLYSVQPLHPFD